MMKEIWIALLKRNGIILGVYAVAMVVLGFMPQLGMAAVWVMLFLMVGMVWANGMLVHHMSRLLAALLTAVMTFVIGGGAVMLTIQIQKLIGRN
ncbi:MAG: hypothetical protein PHW60_15830 [Kiritimatiellae bacterium]|nr:hypothetical protein [Kiritimatiellia bacterium]